jgi:hypothetical protein
MNDTELNEQTAHAFLLWRKDRTTPLEGLVLGQWVKNVIVPNWSDHHYRIAPFTLGNSINGHTLGEGEQWHRVDGWTAESLPSGTRPLFIGEKVKPGDACHDEEYGWRAVCGLIGETAGNDYTNSYLLRTTRPLPSAQLAPGHNPDKLTCAQVGTKDGWRLIHDDERGDGTHSKEFYRALQVRFSPEDEWRDLCVDSLAFNFGPMPRGTMYRTRLSREQLAALDEPPAAKKPAFRPFTFDEVPLTPKVKRKATRETFAPKHSATKHAFAVCGMYFTYAEMLEQFTFLDGTPFGMAVLH